jgi:hypothetical protein
MKRPTFTLVEEAYAFLRSSAEGTKAPSSALDGIDQ